MPCSDIKCECIVAENMMNVKTKSRFTNIYLKVIFFVINIIKLNECLPAAIHAYYRIRVIGVLI